MSSYDLTEAVEAARSALNDRGGHGFRVRPESMVPYCLCGWSADHSLDIAAHDRHIAEVVLTAALPHLEQQIRERVARDIHDAIDAAYGDDDWMHTSACQVTADCPLCIALAAVRGTTRKDTDHD